MPFDEFTIEQLAGDMLPNATIDQRVATGFHRNTMINQEGGVDQEQYRIEAIFDRVATTGTVFLGLTIGCAQCHDHKYDPITQREYYQLFAFFNNQDEPTIVVVPTLEVPHYRHISADFKVERLKLEEKIAQRNAALIDRLADWEKRLTEADEARLPGNVQEGLKIPPPQRDLSRVKTSEDFGAQGENPSHPELLDWLATEFVRQGWSMKATHRLIVTSATYRQSSKLTPELRERDPENILLARASRFRVDGEIVRDIALTVSGLLNSEVGGPSVFPPQPPG